MHTRKHTVVRPFDSTLTLDRTEAQRTADSLTMRTMTPEEHADVLARYGPAVNKPFKRRKGGIPW